MNEIKERWSKSMPKFFKWILGLAAALGGVVVAVNEGYAQYGITPPEWWMKIQPILLGISIGAVAVSKLTVKGGMEKEESKNTILDKDDF